MFRMKLMETLNQCINAGHEMTKAIAIAQFNDDSPEARKITRRWRIGEAADSQFRVINCDNQPSSMMTN